MGCETGQDDSIVFWEGEGQGFKYLEWILGSGTTPQGGRGGRG